MIAQENKYTNLSGVFPSALMIDASGAGLTDGSEFAALPLNDGWEPFSQAVMDYASGNVNNPTGTPGTPNGVADAKGISQIIEGLQVGNAIGPGIRVPWDKFSDPSVTGDRVLLLSGQGILHANYPDLLNAVYVGDANNPTADYYYKATDAAGTTRSTSGTYLILPPSPVGDYLKQYSEANGDFTVTEGSWTTTYANAVYSKTLDNRHYLDLWIKGLRSTGSASSYTLTVSGITTKTAEIQNGAAQVAAGSAAYAGISTVPGTGTLTIHVGSATSGVTGYIRFEMDSKPTWADAFDFKWGITY
jgi:hypothetical protein